jgi:hypothetical protein
MRYCDVVAVLISKDVFRRSMGLAEPDRALSFGVSVSARVINAAA